MLRLKAVLPSPSLSVAIDGEYFQRLKAVGLLQFRIKVRVVKTKSNLQKKAEAKLEIARIHRAVGNDISRILGSHPHRRPSIPD